MTVSMTTAQSEITDIVMAIESITNNIKTASEIVDEVIDAIKKADHENLSGSDKFNKVLGVAMEMYSQYTARGAELRSLLEDLITSVVTILNAGAAIVANKRMWLLSFVEAIKAKIKEIIEDVKSIWDSVWDAFD